MNAQHESTALRHVQLYTDGACSRNPGPGGWAYVLRDMQSKKEKEGCGAEPETTNNRMELQAVIEGLKILTRPCHVTLYADSQYVLKGLKEWMALEKEQLATQRREYVCGSQECRSVARA